MYKCPIHYFTENLIFNEDGSCWAMFRLKGRDYDSLSNDNKIAMIYQLASYLSGIMSEAQIFIIPKCQDLDAYYERFEKELDEEDPLHQKAVSLSRQTAGYLKTISKNKKSDEYLNYICVRLDASSDALDNLKETLLYLFRQPRNALYAWLNLDGKEILASKIQACREKAEKWLAVNSQRVAMEKTGTYETQWMCRRIAYRGTQKEVQMFYDAQDEATLWEPKAEVRDFGGRDRALRPWKKDIVSLFDGKIIPKGNYLELHTDDAISYQSFLNITQLPEKFQTPGCDWIYMLQRYNYQAEICIHVQAIDHYRAIKKIEGKEMEVDEQIEHIRSARGKIGNDLKEGTTQGSQVKEELNANQDGLCLTSVQICVASDDLADMNGKIDKIRQKYKDMQFVTQRSHADQFRLFMGFIPTVGITVKDYILPLTPNTLASGVFGVSHQLGDSAHAPFIGTTGWEKKNVFLNLALACMKNLSPAATFFGNLGQGKSFNSNLLLFLHVVYLSAYGLIIDPKGDRTHWPKEFSIFGGMINLINLSNNPEDAGKLDPWNIYQDNPEEASTLAVNMLLEICGIEYGSDRYIVLKEAAKKVNLYDGPHCMMTLVTLLENWNMADELAPAAKLVARLIRAEKDAGLGNLLIGTGKEETIRLDNRINIIQLQDLTLPEKGKKKQEYSPEEKMSSAIMAAVSQFAKKFSLMYPNIFKVTLIDESWLLKDSTAGEGLMEWGARMGRSLFSCFIFNGHSVLDLPNDEVRNTITYRFCFRTNDEAEARRMLEYLGLEVDQANILRMKSLQNGCCMFRDADGNVGELRFDYVFEDLKRIFDTTPKTKKELRRRNLPGQVQPQQEEPQQEEPQQEKPQQEEPEDDLFKKEVL